MEGGGVNWGGNKMVACFFLGGVVVGRLVILLMEEIRLTA